MDTIPERPLRYKAVAKRATLYTDTTLTHAQTGVALRMPTGQVFFQADTTGLWSELYDDDLPRILLHGQEDLILAAAIADGHLVVRCSQTLAPLTTEATESGGLSAPTQGDTDVLPLR